MMNEFSTNGKIDTSNMVLSFNTMGVVQLGESRSEVWPRTVDPTNKKGKSIKTFPFVVYRTIKLLIPTYE